MDLNDVVDLSGAAEVTGLAVSTIQSYAATGYGGFPKHLRKIGGRRVWSKKELTEWQEGRKR